jgi:hypothetical protein
MGPRVSWLRALCSCPCTVTSWFGGKSARELTEESLKDKQQQPLLAKSGMAASLRKMAEKQMAAAKQKAAEARGKASSWFDKAKGGAGVRAPARAHVPQVVPALTRLHVRPRRHGFGFALQDPPALNRCADAHVRGAREATTAAPSAREPHASITDHTRDRLTRQPSACARTQAANTLPAGGARVHGGAAQTRVVHCLALGAGRLLRHTHTGNGCAAQPSRGRARI